VYTSENLCAIKFSWTSIYACNNPSLVTLSGLVAQLSLGKRLRAVYDFKLCSSGIDSLGGASLDNFQYFGKGAAGNQDAYLSFSESGIFLSQNGAFFNRVVTTRIHEYQAVEIAMTYLDMSTHRVFTNETVNCRFGHSDDGAVFFVEG
jgi:hypothetical protein